MSKLCETMSEPCGLFGAWLGHIWDMSRTCLRNVQDMFVTCVGHVWVGSETPPRCEEVCGATGFPARGPGTALLE